MEDKLRIEIHHYHHDGDQRSQPAANPWLHNMLEKIMSQLDDLQAELNDVKNLAEAIKSGVADQATAMAALHTQLEQLQQTSPPQVDLTPVIAQADTIKQELEGIAAGFAPAAPADTGGSTPPPPPTDTGSSAPADPTGSTGTSDTSGSTTGTGSAAPADPTGGSSPDQTPA